jgi:hypothetical protein
MSWPNTLKDYRKYRKVLARVDGVAITTPMKPPHYKFFGVDSNSNGIYRRYNQDERSQYGNGMFISISYDTLHQYEVIQ